MLQLRVKEASGLLWHEVSFICQSTVSIYFSPGDFCLVFFVSFLLVSDLVSFRFCYLASHVQYWRKKKQTKNTGKRYSPDMLVLWSDRPGLVPNTLCCPPCLHTRVSSPGNTGCSGDKLHCTWSQTHAQEPVLQSTTQRSFVPAEQT